MKVLALNRKAKHDYLILDTIEAGIVLTGDEVKSLRAGNVSLVDSFAIVHGAEMNHLNCYIAPYSHAYKKKDTSRRTRKLLLHRREINRLIGDISRKGLTLIPLKIYLNERGFIKVALGLAKHKKKAEKKRELRERDIKRETEREMKIRIK